MSNSAFTPILNSDFLPSGLIFPYAGSVVPSGFLECEGQEISKTLYPKLYAALQDTYATQFNPVTGTNWAAPAAGNFRVPDYRGTFLRGTGSPSGKDVVTLGGYQADKTAKNGLATSTSSISGTAAAQAWSGSVSGTVSNSGISNATGNNNNLWHNSTTTQAPGDGTAVRFNEWSGTVSGSNSSSSISGTAAAQTLTGDNETRPINKGVKYIVKI